ncbi:hypothetical protein [Streptomyces sp. NPDC056468]|uniref:hypothetical protein n=1 Tax=Streptomyces sp. NPDC056468 TaxID=3345830 RepID=UPI0036C945BD
MPKVLNASAQLMCQHGGTLLVTASQQRLTAGGAPVLVVGDLLAATVVLCPAAPKCTNVMSVTGGTSTALRVAGSPVVLETVQGTTNQGKFQVVSTGQRLLDAR